MLPSGEKDRSVCEWHATYSAGSLGLRVALVSQSLSSASAPSGSLEAAPSSVSLLPPAQLDVNIRHQRTATLSSRYVRLRVGFWLQFILYCLTSVGSWVRGPQRSTGAQGGRCTNNRIGPTRDNPK